MVNQDGIAGRPTHVKYKNDFAKLWTPLPMGWLKWNTDAPELKPKSLLQPVLCVEIIMDEYNIVMERKLTIVQFCWRKL